MKSPRFAAACLPLVLTFTDAALAAASTTQPDLLNALNNPDSAARRAQLDDFANHHLNLLAAYNTAALDELHHHINDPDPRIRSDIAFISAFGWAILPRPNPDPAATAQAIDINIQLATDPDDTVRHDAVTMLKQLKTKDDAVITALVESVLKPDQYNDWVAAQAIVGLSGENGGKVDPARLQAVLEPYWANAAKDPNRAAAAYVLFKGATQQDPPNLQRLDSVGYFCLPIQARAADTPEELRDGLQRQLPPGAIAGLQLIINRGQLQGRLAIAGLAHRRQVVDLLHRSHLATPLDDFSQYTGLLLTPTQYQKLLADCRSAELPTQPTTHPDYAASFNDLYTHLATTYPEFQMKQIDWPAVGRDLLPQAQHCETDAQFGLLVERLVAKLQDSHAIVEPGSAAVPDPDLPQYDPGFACLSGDHDQPIIYDIAPNSPAAQAGLRPGAIVISINGIPADKAIQTRMDALSTWFGYSSNRTLRYDAVRTFARQDYGAIVHLTVQAPTGQTRTLDLPATSGDRYLPRLPVPRNGIEDAADTSSATLAPGIGYIYLRRITSSLESNLDAALNSLGPVHALVLDLRGNSGGGFDSDTAFANFDPTNHAPDHPHYNGPIAILIDARTISAAEGYASWFRANHRATFFGQTTAGASSRKEEYTLTNGLFKVIIPVKPYTGFLDRPIERQGIEPDVPVSCTPADIAAAQDTVANAALHWLQAAPNPAAASGR